MMASSDLLKVTSGNAQFANKFYSIICKQEGNVSFSPLSAHSMLSMAYQGASGETAKQFMNTLKVQDQEVTANGYNAVLNALNNVENSTLNIANKITVTKDLPTQPAFKRATTDMFLSEVESVDFSRSEEVATSIREWVERKTNSKIGELISKEDLDKLTRLVLANAVYFKGNWAQQFEAESTTTESFYLNNNDQVNCQMMHITGCFNYREHEVLGAKILELPYKNENVCMVVILPNAKDGIADLENKLNIIELSSLMDNLNNVEVQVSLPKFKFETRLDLQDVLEKMGLGVIFDQKKADFSKVSENSENDEELEQLYISNIIEKTFMEINEKGTEVSAATVNKSRKVAAAFQIYQMHVKSDIRNRFAHTTITSKVKNLSDRAQEATFSVVLPETAFISGFIMEVDGKKYTAYVKEKEEAKVEYNRAVASGLGAAHVAVSARDSNRFTVSVNVEPESEAAFYLTYEQLLKRQDGHYEQVINIHPGQPVKDLRVEVVINESRKIIKLKAPPIRSGKEIGKETPGLDPRANLEILNDTTAIVTFTPDLKRQKQLAQLLGTDGKDGLAGQFVVQYEVERDPQGGEVLIQDGYFVHFFAPSELTPLPKHVVFILDTSGSMHGQKIRQLKQAMCKILEQIHETDLFSLVEFNFNVKVWNLDNSASSFWYPNENNQNYNRDVVELSFQNVYFPNAYPANTDNIRKAKAIVSELKPDGGTDIYTALRVGLHLVEVARGCTDTIKPQPIIVFLTDGEPTVRLTITEVIVNKISEFNCGPRKSPIFALSFGDGADRNFLQKLALRNSGFSKHIYEAADASLQLQDFYRQISSPLLTNVTFKYEPSGTSLTTTDFPIHFDGSELIVSGWCGTITTSAIVEGWSRNGRISFRPRVERAVSSIERLWAYLTVKQLLEKKETSDTDKEELEKKALDLALKYSFVTPVSSLVVVKPDSANAVDTEEAREERRGLTDQSMFAGSQVNMLAGTSRSMFAAPVFRKAGLRSVRNAFTGVCFGSPSNAMVPQSSIFNFTSSSGRMPLQQQSFGFAQRTQVEGFGQRMIVPEEKEEKKKISFVADHPFIIILVHKQEASQTVLFFRRVSKLVS